METKVTTHITKGVIIALILIVLDLIGHLTGILFEDWFRYSILVLAVGLFIWPPVQYGKELNNNVTFGNLFAHGFKTAAVFTCITFVYTLLVIYVLFPDFVDQLIQKQFEKAAASGKTMPTPSAEGMQMARKITNIIMLAGAVIGNLLVGAIGALIGAAITKKKPQDPFGNQPV